ncbi:MAG: hypothetical protein JW976_06500 [Syntrophaceae bacterium]|nr:hypothetical protein [Syntrophaceae bacterium]
MIGRLSPRPSHRPLAHARPESIPLAKSVCFDGWQSCCAGGCVGSEAFLRELNDSGRDYTDWVMSGSWQIYNPDGGEAMQTLM